jgi:RNA polymerase sigma factor (sigma-70 family)
VATDDDRLIEDCRRGDRASWDELVTRYHRLVRSIAAAHGLRGDDIDEVVQVVFTVLFKQLDRFHPDTRLAPWLATVSRRHVWRVLAQRRREVASETVPHDGGYRPVDEHADRLGEAEWLRAGMDMLSGRCQQLLKALYISPDRSYVEVSEELNIPVGSIGPTRARCLEQLRRHLAELQPTGAVSDG